MRERSGYICVEIYLHHVWLLINFKQMKHIIVALLIIPIIIVIGGLTRYNRALNDFISQNATVHLKHRDKQKSDKTEVHIVGSIHFESASIKRHDLYNYIDRISPSVILYEGDSSTIKRIVNKTDYFARIIDAFKKGKKMEKPIVLKYLHNNPDCIVLPYEWELRDNYHRKHKLRKRSKEMINLVLGLYLDKELNKDESAIIDEFLALNKALTKIDENGTITDINSWTTDSILKQRQHYIYKAIPEIGKARKELAEYLDFIPIHMAYWDTRNKAMAQNILKQIKRNPNKAIVVLNGFYHRYYLIDELKPYETEYGFTIKGIE